MKSNFHKHAWGREESQSDSKFFLNDMYYLSYSNYLKIQLSILTILVQSTNENMIDYHTHFQWSIIGISFHSSTTLIQ